MRIYIDIGNTNVTSCFSDHPEAWFKIPTRDLFEADAFARKLKKISLAHKVLGAEVDEAVICSVVPKADRKIRKQLKACFKNSKVSFLGSDIKIPIKNNYARPRQVGKDRLINALAAKHLYSVPAVVIDFGTAITIDVISAKGAYEGGVILPGIEMSVSALHENTALLPLVKPSWPKALVGKNTRDSILSGVFYGNAFMIDGFVTELCRRFSLKVCVIATGGDWKVVRKICNTVRVFDSLLTLKGIEIARNLRK